MDGFHILVIRFSSLGDMVLNSSVLEHLQDRFGEKIKISFLTSRMFCPLYEGHPAIDKIYGFSREKGISGIKALFSEVKKIHAENPIDLIFDLHGTLRSILLRIRFFFIPRIFIDKRTLERTLLTTFKINLLSSQGIVSSRKKDNENNTRYGEWLLARNIQDFLGVIGFTRLNFKKNNRLSSCTQTFKDDEHFILKNISSLLVEKKFVCVVPSASFAEKRWPENNFYNLLEIIFTQNLFSDLVFVILAGPTDDFCKRFDLLKEKFPIRFINLQGKTSIVESTMLVKKALFCVGNDTGIPHIAEAVGTPSLFILGPTGEEFGFYPHLTTSDTVMLRLWCRPCTTNGKGNCIRKSRYCLNEITPSMVLEKMKIMYEKNKI